MTLTAFALALIAGGTLLGISDRDGSGAQAMWADGRVGPPEGRVLFGVQLDWAHDDPAAYAARLGRTPALFGEFVDFPFTPELREELRHKAQQSAEAGAIFMVTLEPHAGLASVDEAALDDLTRQLAAWNRAGARVLVRFAHEMNGSWYPWGQQPPEYVEAFRRTAAAVRRAPAAEIVWSPNEGGGYGFRVGGYGAKEGTPEFEVLDTNGDGNLTMEDDPYGPYYPGDEHVDWVGLSLYHFGDAWPWGENTVPESDKFVGKLTGTYVGALSDERAVPDFYAEYAAERGKPLMLSETAAMFNVARDGTGATNLEIKSAWWAQVLSPEVARQFPHLKIVNWFEHRKQEHDLPAGAVTDWTATIDPTIRDAFASSLPAHLVFADPPLGDR